MLSPEFTRNSPRNSPPEFTRNSEARRDAQAMVADDPELSHPDHARLRRMMLVRYGRALELGDVG